jgi:DNA mismatch endonuclease, patch repair protein
MADVFTKNKRSLVMSAIRSKGNRDTELKLATILKQNGITGWRRNIRLPGKPDFVFRRERLAIFVDGCFWHGCSRHLRMPASNVEYWNRKIERNRTRDRRVDLVLRRTGWRTVRIWEHSLREPTRVVNRLLRLLEKGKISRLAHCNESRLAS